ncbi:MAG: hypothetical protein U5L72_08505 [Bacteroidales bacterium]|nr:hypothetical protein [Bacteroidales bacterium]
MQAKASIQPIYHPTQNAWFWIARGDIFTLPAKEGHHQEHTHSSCAHDRVWRSVFPDGEHIAYISDKNGEDEIYIQQQDGSGFNRYS